MISRRSGCPQPDIEYCSASLKVPSLTRRARISLVFVTQQRKIVFDIAAWCVSLLGVSACVVCQPVDRLNYVIWMTYVAVSGTVRTPNLLRRTGTSPDLRYHPKP